MHRQRVIEFFDLSWIVDIREIEKTIIICGLQWTRTTPVRTWFTVRLPYPNDFYFPFVPRDGIEPPPFVCKTNTLPLRHRGNLYREMVSNHSRNRYEPSPVPDLSVIDKNPLTYRRTYDFKVSYHRPRLYIQLLYSLDTFWGRGIGFYFGGHRLITYSWGSTKPVEVIVGFEPT